MSVLAQTSFLETEIAPDQGTRLPQYARTPHPPPMRLTQRDSRILETIHSFDGVVSVPQLQRLFAIGRSQLQLRLKLLYQHGFLNRPDRRQRALCPVSIVWLGRRGAAYLAGLSGDSLQGFRWRSQPKWLTLDHDLAVNDCRIALTNACQQQPRVALREWITQATFWRTSDKVTYTEGPSGKTKSRRIRPDGYSLLQLGERQLRLFWEVDRRTEDNPRWGREKVYPYLAYRQSEVYRERFGAHGGWILTVTTGARRLQHMKTHTERAVGAQARVFWFTTQARIQSDTVLDAPIWWRGGYKQPQPLLPP